MKYADYTPHLQGVLRIGIAILFMTHGSQKLFGVPGGTPIEIDNIVSLFGFAGILEFFGGIFLLIGFSTRPVAFLLFCEMAVAYLKVHLQQSPWPLLNGGELALLYGFIFLFLSAAGAGKFSIDRNRGYE